ncbi:hypothetical protein BD769DRAFT_1491024 [Suillus cothurnatus]|nr:hypothetical protein BD769DRAFT_1491024 [Suillus cothurnatus]
MSGHERARCSLPVNLLQVWSWGTCVTGIWVHVNAGAGAGAQGAAGLGRWDEGVLEIVGGSREEGRRIRTWLGDMEVAGGRKAVHTERYGFESDTVVTPFTSDYLSSYLSLCPSPRDAVFSFGPMDTLLTPLNVTSTLQPIPPSCPGSQ